MLTKRITGSAMVSCGNSTLRSIIAAAHGSGSSATARRDGAAIEILADDAGRVVARCEDVEQVGVDVLDVVERVEERLARRT